MFLLDARLSQVLQWILFNLSARPSTLHASPAHSTRPSHTPLVPRTLYSSPTHSIHPPHTRTVLPTMNGKAEPSSVRLICSKGEILEVERSVAMKLKYVKNLIDKMDVTSGCAIPMGGIDKHTLNAIFRFIKYTTDMEKNQDPKRMESWKQFFENEDFSLLKLIEVRFSSSIFHLVSVSGLLWRKAFVLTSWLPLTVHIHCLFLIYFKRLPSSSIFRNCMTSDVNGSYTEFFVLRDCADNILHSLIQTDNKGRQT